MFGLFQYRLKAFVFMNGKSCHDFVLKSGVAKPFPNCSDALNSAQDHFSVENHVHEFS